jgi:beta-fructofuranosidase
MANSARSPGHRRRVRGHRRRRPFGAEPKLFAAPLVRDRAGQWVLLGFRNQEAEGIHSFDLIDPIPVEVREGALAVRPA